VRGGERVTEWVNLIKVPYLHTWKYCKQTPHFVQLIYTNKKERKSKDKSLIKKMIE
jgi:hypothetical protein